MILEKVYDELYGMIEDLKKKIQAAEKSDVTITPALESGTKLADFEIDGTEGTIYGPTVTNYEWVKLGEYTSGTIDVTIPSDAIEIQARVYAEASSGVYIGHVFDFLKDVLTDSYVTYTAGSYYTAQDCCSIVLSAKSDQIHTASVTYVGTPKIPYTTIYYKRIANTGRSKTTKKK